MSRRSSFGRVLLLQFSSFLFARFSSNLACGAAIQSCSVLHTMEAASSESAQGEEGNDQIVLSASGPKMTAIEAAERAATSNAVLSAKRRYTEKVRIV